MCRNVTRSHVILFAQTLFWFDFFQVQPPSFISHLHHPCPSLKRCGPGSEMLLNASQTTWTPASPPTALTLHSAKSLDVKRRERLSRSAPALLSATSLDVERRGRPRLPSPSHPPLCHVTTSSVEDISPGLPPPSSLPRHLTLSIEDASPPVCHRPPLCHVTSHLARLPPPATALSKAPQHLVTHCKQFYYYFSHFNSSYVYESA